MAGYASKISKEIIGVLAGAIERGLSERRACALAGITYVTLRSWQKTAKGHENAINRPDPLYEELVHAMELASAKYIESRLKHIQDVALS